MTTQHPWKLVGPWYRWHNPDRTLLPAPIPNVDGIGSQFELGRASKPVLQKYSTSKFVDEFLKDPQKSLRYDPTDVVYETSANGQSRSARDCRKVFLNMHSRFYLVVCELHCDTTGFPNVNREQVCEAGFVVRRRRVTVPSEAKADVEAALGKLSQARFQLNEAKAGISLSQDSGPFRKTLHEATRAGRQRELARIQDKFSGARAEFEALVEQYKIGRQIEGWLPSIDDIGRWDVVEEMPDEVYCRKTQTFKEACYPLYPLIPDPRLQDHSSEGRSVWFGVLPTGGAEMDENGSPRFDDRHTYEVRCFVRRHRAHCPKTRGPNDCGGQLVWSAATDPFRLAPHFDLDGTSNRVTMIQVPDLEALRAQVSSPDFQMGQGVGVGMVTPSKSELDFDVGADMKPVKKGIGATPSICFFAIPLITIVAMFVLRLFLPIVVFLFQLWYLLMLKFCIPPAFSLSGGLSAELDANLDFELDASVNFDAQLKTKIQTAVENLGSGAAAKLKGQLDAGELTYTAVAQLALDQSADFSADLPQDLAEDLPPPGNPNRVRERPKRSVVYYERVRAKATS